MELTGTETIKRKEKVLLDLLDHLERMHLQIRLAWRNKTRGWSVTLPRHCHHKLWRVNTGFKTKKGAVFTDFCFWNPCLINKEKRSCWRKRTKQAVTFCGMPSWSWTLSIVYPDKEHVRRIYVYWMPLNRNPGHTYSFWAKNTWILFRMCLGTNILNII